MANELITMDKPWETRDHRKVRLLTMDMKNRDGFNVVGIVTRENGTEFAMEWKEDGTCWNSGSPEAQWSNKQLDLIPVVTKHEVWCVVRNNMWWDGSIHVLSHESALAEKERLDKEIPNEEHRIALITWEG